MTISTGLPGHPRDAGVPARSAGTPTRSSATPARSTNTPARSTSTGTPARTTGTSAPKRARPGRIAARPPRLRTPGDDQRPWSEQAACRGTDPELFFPVASSNRSESRKQVADARSVCQTCPVIESCRSWALAYPDLAEYGVWGGLSEAERRPARRRTVRVAAQRTAS